jgi:hypothetical protein
MAPACEVEVALLYIHVALIRDLRHVLAFRLPRFLRSYKIHIFLQLTDHCIHNDMSTIAGVVGPQLSAHL